MADVIKRPLKILKLLAGKSLQGMRLKDIAKALDENEPTTCRTLKKMVDEGFVTQFEHNDHYALSSSCLAIATAHSIEIGQAQQRIEMLTQRINANAHQFLP